METLAKERDLLLQRTARFLGLSIAALALANFLLLSSPTTGYVLVLALFGVLAITLLLVGRTRSLAVVGTGIAAGLGLILALTQLPDIDGAEMFLVITPIAGGVISAFSFVLLNGSRRRAILITAAVATFVISGVASGQWLYLRLWLVIGLGWLLIIVLAFWIGGSIPRAARRIYSIGRAHRAERRASETEAQRRQSARLLHDTVLATLTLLAHSGSGVTPDALRQQAGEDAALLRQLRLGAAPAPQPAPSPGAATVAPVAAPGSTGEIALGTTLESVKQRFGRMGLTVSWHGTGQVLLPSHVLDAFLLALAECLENVRRHSGVTEAHVTISEDEATVRALVTDSGTGFDIANIDEARLGIKESVIGRLSEVGGHARLFSAAGSGTTVVLEVPRV